jgi:hypothetical protein
MGGACPHERVCPAADSRDRDAARVVRTHPDQGWSLLCNGVILFEDTGEILPTGATVEPRRFLPARPLTPITPTGASLAGTTLAGTTLAGTLSAGASLAGAVAAGKPSLVPTTSAPAARVPGPRPR